MADPLLSEGEDYEVLPNGVVNLNDSAIQKIAELVATMTTPNWTAAELEAARLDLDEAWLDLFSPEELDSLG